MTNDEISLHFKWESTLYKDVCLFEERYHSEIVE